MHNIQIYDIFLKLFITHWKPKEHIYFFLIHFRLHDGNGHTATVSFTVSVADIADETPVITTPTNMQTISFNENDEMAGTLSISIQGTDADAGETMTFSLATNPMSLFELTTTATASTLATATVGLATGNTLDFETTPNTYDLEVA